MSFMQGKADANFEEVSQGTVPVHQDLVNPELTQIYGQYNFACRQKENLTITSLENKIVSLIETNRVVVVQGPTGCGKSTQVPQFILDACVKKNLHCNIIGKNTACPLEFAHCFLVKFTYAKCKVTFFI